MHINLSKYLLLVSIMFTLIGLLVFVGSVRGAFVPRIVNGEDANIEDYPYHISIEVNERYWCGGSLISKTRILTAAHCTDNRHPSTLRVRAGTSIREQGGQLRAVSENHVHPDWANRVYDNDVAVLVLSEPLELNDKVQIVKLAVDDNQSVGSYATITGWGSTENGTLATTLQKLDQAKNSDETCTRQLGDAYNSLSQVCYQAEWTKTTCGGDSGGPLVQNGVQVGIDSYGTCEGTTATGFTKVSYFLPYIQNLM